MCATPTQSRVTTEITERSQFIVSKVFLPPLARLLMSSLFVWDGIVQLRNPGGTAQYFASVHVPAPDIAVWISILVHLLGGLALLAGFYTRWAAALLVLVCLGTAFGVHLPAGSFTSSPSARAASVSTGEPHRCPATRIRRHKLPFSDAERADEHPS